MLSLVITTYPAEREAEKIADILLKKKMAACIKLQKVKSSYWWKGKLVKENETIVTIITARKNVKKIVSTIKSKHSCEVPEIIEIPVNVKNKDYLEWACNVTK